MNAPLLWQREKLPFTASLAASMIMSVLFLPTRIGVRCVPYNLRVRTYQKIISPALKFLSVRGIKDFVVLPVISQPHNNIQPFLYIYDTECF